MDASHDAPSPAAGQAELPRPGAVAEPVTVVVLGPPPDRRRGNWAVLMALVDFAAGAFLIVMFVSLARGGSAAPWGPINDVLGAIGNVLLALLVPHLSRNAARSRWARGLVRTVVAGSLVAAASGLALVVELLPFEQSTAISIVVLVAQCAWMIWLSRSWTRDPGVPRTIARLGVVIGITLLADLVLVGASLLLPFGSPAANSLLIPGVALGGLAWLSWPLWYLLIGLHLRRDDAGR